MDLISRIALAIVTFFGTMASKQASDEFKAWTPWVVNRLINRAASKYPEHKERLIEEYHGRVFDIPGEIGKIFFAVKLQFNAEESMHLLPGKILALLFIVVYAPLLILISLAILSSGQRTLIIKHLNIDGVHVYKFNAKGPLGSFLRKSSLDQLPFVFYLLKNGASRSKIVKDVHSVIIESMKK